MAEVTIYTGFACGFCARAKQLLKLKGAEFKEISVSLDAKVRAEMTARASGARSVPQIFIDELHVGGCDELYDLERAGKLDQLLGLETSEDV